MPQLFPTSTTSVVDDDEAERIEVSDDALIEVEDSGADINALIPQPPAGIYLMRASLADTGEKDNPYKSATKEGKPFVTAKLTLSIADESSEFFGFEITEKSTNLNSLSQKARKTSALHHFMNCIGEPLPTSMRVGEILEKVKAALESKPLVMCELDWRASAKVGPGKYDWDNVAMKMTDFPKDKESDGRSLLFPYNKNGTVIYLPAKTYVAKYLQQG